MAINFIHGPPGSGKTYYAVNHLLSEYFKYDKGKDEYLKKDKNLKIVTNIDEFLPDHYPLDDWILHAGSVEDFFSFATQEKIHKKHSSLIYMIDEAHMFFPSTFKNQEVIKWFSYHRHWGQTIYLMSQAYSMLPRQITDMVELNVKALPASTTLLGGRDLKYNIMSGREIVDRKALIKNNRIFRQYRSQFSNAKEKTKNPLIKYIVGCAIITLLLVGNAVRWAADFGKHDENPQSIKEDTSTIEIAELEVREQQLPVPPPPKKATGVPVGVSWAKFKTTTVVFFQDKMYTLKDFPYPVSFNGIYEMIAYIPPEKLYKEKTTHNAGEGGSSLSSGNTRSLRSRTKIY
jgi:hypothetical protein